MNRINILFVLFLVFFSAAAQDAIIDKNSTYDYDFFGDKIDSEKVVTSSYALNKFQEINTNDTLALKFSAIVTDVCKVKGCWMKLDLGDNQEAMVRFKEYSFFVPKDITGKEVIVNGLAFVKETSVKEQQHYALDAGESKEEIAKITTAKKTYSFIANGVLLKK